MNVNVQVTCHQELLKRHRFHFMIHVLIGQPICLDFIQISSLQIRKDLLLGTEFM